MTFQRTWIRVAAALVLGGGVAWAGKPGGGGGGPVDTGTIYFSVATGSTYQIHRMNPDGTGKTALPVYSPWFNGPADPSRALHGGRRWFIIRTPIVGETTITGGQKTELSAVRDDGASVRLTHTQPDIIVSAAYFRWGPQDAQIAWHQMRWDGAQTVPDGICVADVAFDVSGNVTGLVATPNVPAVPFQTGSSGQGGFDWSPDGTRLAVYNRFETPGQHTEMRIVSLSTLASVTLVSNVADGGTPSWSPDGLTIAYDDGSLRAVNADGTDNRLLEANGTSGGVYRSFTNPCWSPNGVNLVFMYGLSKPSPGRVDVGRCVPTGGTVTNLSSGMTSTTCIVLGWR